MWSTLPDQHKKHRQLHNVACSQQVMEFSPSRPHTHPEVEEQRGLNARLMLWPHNNQAPKLQSTNGNMTPTQFK